MIIINDIYLDRKYSKICCIFIYVCGIEVQYIKVITLIETIEISTIQYLHKKKNKLLCTV